MSLRKFIDGMNILIGYYDNPEGYHIGAEHDEVFFYRTDKPVSPEDVTRLHDLGWFQNTQEENEDGSPVYDQEESWCFFV